MASLPAIVMRPAATALGGRSRDALLAELRGRLAGRVREAWLFGSVARGNHGAESDVDLLLVQETTAPFVERADAFFDLRDLARRIEILVYTPAEMARLAAQDSPGFWRDVLRSRIRIL